MDVHPRLPASPHVVVFVTHPESWNPGMEQHVYENWPSVFETWFCLKYHPLIP